MKLHIVVITVFLQIKLNYAFYDRFLLHRFGIQEYVLNLSSVNITKRCNNTEQICIFKCCPEGHILNRFKACIKSDQKLLNMTVYNKNYLPTNKSLSSAFKMVPDLMSDEIFAKNSLWWYKRKAYLIEDGNLYLKFPNVYDRWKKIETNHFCVDNKINGTSVIPVFMAEYEIMSNHPTAPSTYQKCALMISTLFLVLILVVYSVIEELRDLNGIVLMIHFCTLIVTFITHFILESFNTVNLWLSQILIITFVHYFFKISSLCWTNVIFYRILVSSCPSNGDKLQLFKSLLTYGAYAFGLSLLMTIFAAVIEVSDMTDTPSFITPQIQNKGNFRFQEMESIFYLYIPLILILAFNWFVCFIKVIQFCSTKRRFATVSQERDARENGFNRPIQFVKLLAILSIYVLLEMLTVIYLKGTHETTSTLILALGFVIMLIFVWDMQVIKLLTKQLQNIKTKSSSHHLVTYFANK